jgi:hypothetical protein
MGNNIDGHKFDGLSRPTNHYQRDSTAPLHGWRKIDAKVLRDSVYRGNIHGGMAG